MKDAVLIKSFPNGITLLMREDVSMEEILQELTVKFTEARNFFGNSTMALSMEGRKVTEAEEILTQAEQNASRIRVTKRMSTLPAFHPGDLEPEDREALRTAGDIYAASLIYTDEMLTEVNDLLADSYDLVKQQYAKMVETLEEKTRIVAENKAELMGNLKELSKEERYAQILELGQLLSNELYDEKNKVKLAAAKKKPVKLEYEEETGKEEKEQKS